MRKSITLLVIFLVLVVAVVLVSSPVSAGTKSDAETCQLLFSQKRYEEAFPSCKKAAEQGVAEAQCNLGLMYANGRGVQKEPLEAIKWFRKAAKQGLALAQYILGVMYANGQGVKKDPVEGVRWYRKAARQGFTKAQYNLGVMYALGNGVMRSGAAAADWLYRAGLSFLKTGRRDNALRCVELIRDLKDKYHMTVPNVFLADKLMNKIYK